MTTIDTRAMPEGDANLAATTTSARSRLGAATVALRASAAFWFATVFVGQWAFLYYIAAFYGTSIVQGDFKAWNRNTNLFNGYVAGDTIGNLVFAAHVLLAGVVAFGGTLQLIPQIRARVPAVHRWNGRVFLFTAMAASIGGLYMAWMRPGPGFVSRLSITLDAVLIIAFGALAWRAARAREISTHRRWALRTFIVANGVWFQRIGFMAWIIVNQGPVAMKPFSGFWQWGCYLLPLLVLELYLRAKDGTAPREQFVVASGLVLLTLLMGAGILGIYMFSWRPLISLSS